MSLALERATEVAVLEIVLQQQVGDLVRDREPDRADADDSRRDDDPGAVADLDHARLRAFEIFEHDLRAELLGERLDVDRPWTLGAEPRDRFERTSAGFRVTRGFARLLLRRLPRPLLRRRHVKPPSAPRMPLPRQAARGGRHRRA